MNKENIQKVWDIGNFAEVIARAFKRLRNRREKLGVHVRKAYHEMFYGRKGDIFVIRLTDDGANICVRGGVDVEYLEECHE